MALPKFVEATMLLNALKCLHSVFIFACCFFLSAAAMGQIPLGIGGSLTVYVQGSDGVPVDQMAVVTLSGIGGQFLQQATTRGGTAEFTSLPGGNYRVSAVATGYEQAVEQVQLGGAEASIVSVRLKPVTDGHSTAAPAGPPILAPKAKMELGKALEAMRAGKLPEAHGHLLTAYHLAPGSPEVNYIFGLYSAQANDWGNARSYWEKVLNLYPRHVGALLSMGTLFLRDNKPAEAASYYKKAIEAEPSSWRGHALLADACLRQGFLDEAVSEAERAAELGRGQAAMAQPLLARALAKRGDTVRAVQILQKYLQEHPSDVEATQLLGNLQSAPTAKPAGALDSTLPTRPLLTELTILLPPSTWLPPDVDDRVPPVEPGTTCQLDEVLQAGGKRVQEFVSNVDRFTATESITHESFNKWGLASSPAKFRFDYVVSIGEVGPKLLNVEEFRTRAYASTKFPDGIERSGLPALILIFHPYYAGNFEMVCEGLAHWNGKLAWQVHFLQRNDRPNTIRAYRFGENGASFAAALKGRAWIAADSYQIVRLETDLVAPMPQIRLVADHAAVDYGPVYFRARKVDMWVPQSAEFYYDWKGHRGHRVHSFSNYLLFSVSDKERISAPKSDNTPTTIPPRSSALPER